MYRTETKCERKKIVYENVSMQINDKFKFYSMSCAFIVDFNANAKACSLPYERMLLAIVLATAHIRLFTASAAIYNRRVA